MNQTALVSFCSLNLTKHKSILDDLEANNMISRTERMMGKKTIAIYLPTQQGIELCRSILEPYEVTFMRRNETTKEHNIVAENVPLWTLSTQLNASSIKALDDLLLTTNIKARSELNSFTYRNQTIFNLPYSCTGSQF